MTTRDPAALVKAHALTLGFDSVGIADLTPTPHAEQLRQWLKRGLAGTMTYMHRQAERRCEPARILEGATRAVVVTRNYYRPDPVVGPDEGLLAKYARGPDYHDALREPLEKLSRFIEGLGEAETVVAKAYVDAGPVPERELAQRAGLGWIGKNTMLIDPRRGSYFFLATVLTNLDLATDLPFQADRCGSCRRCLDACPTQAFPEERLLDSRRCISYLTIEHRGEIEPALAGQMGNRVFGCDICQDVCPWNVNFAREMNDSGAAIPPELEAVNLQELEDLSDEGFEARYGHTALSRPGAAGLRRNAGIARENSRRSTWSRAG